MSNAGRALLIVLVPIAWCAACLAGWIWSIRALRAGDGISLPIAALALNVPNTMFAAIFLLAAVMGG